MELNELFHKPVCMNHDCEGGIDKTYFKKSYFAQAHIHMLAYYITMFLGLFTFLFFF